MKNCIYCENEFKNKHGLHIHWYYCRVKLFKSFKVVFVDDKKQKELWNESLLLPIRSYPKVYLKFIKYGEIGMIKGMRYVLKS